ncbi:kelch domain-containing protein 2-like [Elysia marginata]|uniref:Kelch domain-containing protein 2-like n=1 Tax=Elysia marginata TaxID=1093978 RepID=A0AAV4JMD8_9GAST|nr:kelch domain-containing protein 2-like [Elysia marginata]
MNNSILVQPLSTFASWIECRRLPQGEVGSVNPDEIYCPERVGHVAVCILDELLVWGGYHERRLGYGYCTGSEVWSYNLDLDRWFKYVPHGNSPEFASGACSAVVWPYWYIFLGHNLNGNSNEMSRLNLQTCTWESVGPEMRISPRDKSVAWVFGSKIFVFGGYGVSPYTTYLWNRETDVFSKENWNDERGWDNQIASFDTLTNQWHPVETRGPKPKARAAHSAVRVGEAVYIFGGRSGGMRMADLHRLDLLDLTWSGELSCQGQRPEGRSWHTMSALSRHKLVLMGGYNTSGQILDDLWLLSLESMSWSILLQHSNRFRLWHTSCANSMGDVLIFGGCTNDILDNSRRMEASDHVLTVRLEPFSLERLCMHRLWRNGYSNQAGWDSLPRSCQLWLEAYKRSNSEINRRIYRCNATSLHGPSLRQLTVLQPDQANYINMNIFELERWRALEQRLF